AANQWFVRVCFSSALLIRSRGERCASGGLAVLVERRCCLRTFSLSASLIVTGPSDLRLAMMAPQREEACRVAPARLVDFMMLYRSIALSVRSGPTLVLLES